MDYLCEDTSIESITVSSICQNAKISRTVFYRLFEDKYEVANWFMSQAINPGISERGRTLTWSEGIIVTLSGCELLKNLMCGAWKSPGYHAMKETGIRKCRDNLTETVVSMKGVELTEELRLQIDFYAHSESYVVRNWIADRDHCSIEEIAHLLETCVPPTLHDLLAVPIDPQPMQKLTWATLVMLSS